MSIDIMNEWNKLDAEYQHDPIYLLAEKLYNNATGEYHEDNDIIYINHDLTEQGIEHISYDEEAGLYEYDLTDSKVKSLVKYIRHFQSNPSYGGVPYYEAIEGNHCFIYALPPKHGIIYPEDEYQLKLNKLKNEVIKYMPYNLVQLAELLKEHITKITYDDDDGGLILYLEQHLSHPLLCTYMDNSYVLDEEYNTAEYARMLIAYYYTLPCIPTEDMPLFHMRADKFFTMEF